MMKALRVTMIVYGVIGILFGLAFIIIPDQMSDWFNVAKFVDFGRYIITLVGVVFIVMSVFFIMVASDLTKNILWVKFAIAEALTGALTAVYALIRSYGDFSQVGVGIIVHAVFAILLLVFYPWKSKAAS